MKNLLPHLFLIATLHASPAWVAQLSPSQPGPHPAISPSTLDFSLSWQGMLKAGSLQIDFAPENAKKPGSLVIQSSASSQGAAAALFPFQHTHWSEINPTTLAAKFFNSTEIDSRESITTTNRYTRSHVSITELTTSLKSKTTTTKSFKLPFAPTYDLYSAILFIRSQPLKIGEEHTLLLQPFASPLLLKVRVEAREKHLDRSAIRLSFFLRKIDRETFALQPYQKLKKPVTVWLSDDTDRVPIELRAAVYIGDVRAILTRFVKHP